MDFDPKQLLVLQYCLSVLRERTRNDAEFSWLWKIKEKVALGCIQMIRNRSEDDREIPTELSEDDKRAIRESHPLLENTEFYRPRPFFHRHPELFEQMRRNVERYAQPRNDEAQPCNGQVS